MTVRVFRSRRATAEVEEIAAFLAEHNPPAAERFLEALARAYQLLSEHPDVGAPGIRPGTRRLVVGNTSFRTGGADTTSKSSRSEMRGGEMPGSDYLPELTIRRRLPVPPPGQHLRHRPPRGRRPAPLPRVPQPLTLPTSDYIL